MTTPDSNATLSLAVIPGDGIGPEVTAEALKVLEAAAPDGVKFEPTRYDLGAERYLATGEVLPDSVLAEIREHDAILLRMLYDPRLRPGMSAAEVRPLLPEIVRDARRAQASDERLTIAEAN